MDCDGSHVVYTTNPENTDDYVKPQKDGDRGYNQLHLNALYDIVNSTFVDAIIQPGVKQDEHLALYDMLEHYEPANPSHTILITNRFPVTGQMGKSTPETYDTCLRVKVIRIVW